MNHDPRKAIRHAMIIARSRAADGGFYENLGRDLVVPRTFQPQDFPAPVPLPRPAMPAPVAPPAPVAQPISPPAQGWASAGDSGGGNSGPGAGGPSGAPGTGNFGSDIASFAEATAPGIAGGMMGGMMAGPPGAMAGAMAGMAAANAMGMNAQASPADTEDADQGAAQAAAEANADNASANASSDTAGGQASGDEGGSDGGSDGGSGDGGGGGGAGEWRGGAIDKADGGAVDYHEIEAKHFADGGEVFDEPQKTVKAYKLFRIKKSSPGQLFPLYVNANKPVPIGRWIAAEEGPMRDGKVKSSLGDLAYRPGWHAGDLPMATHIGNKSSPDKTKPDYRPDEHVWAEVEMPADVDWQSVADQRAKRTKSGAIDPKTAHITDQIPHGGFYRYKTNPNMTGNWLISGGLKVNRVLSDDEVKEINDQAGVADLPRLRDLKASDRYADGGMVNNDPFLSNPVPIEGVNGASYTSQGDLDARIQQAANGQGYADGGDVPPPPRDLGADPTVQRALDLTRQNDVSPVAAARSVALGETYGRENAPAYSQAGPEAGGLPFGRGVSRSAGLLPSSDQAPLEGLPTRIKVPLTGEVITAGPNHQVRAIAEQYMRDAGLPYNPPTKYAKVDAARAKRIADEYERMGDDPNHPLVKAAYDAMIRETMAQYQAAKAAGFKAEFWDPETEKDPYEASPRMAIEDVNNNHHMYVFPTYFGYGSKEVPADAAKKNPLLADSGERWNGHTVTVNDIFRAVHDYFGHAKEGVGFRHDGEENAWRSHAAMYSPLALLAMTSETRGQNSWLNFGPHGEKNRHARTEDTVFADQKIGIMPPWTTHEGAEDFLSPEKREAMEQIHKQYAKARGDRIGYADGGGQDDPTVQRALDITRQAQPDAMQMARQIQSQPMSMPKVATPDDHPAWIPTRLVTSKKAVATPGQKDIVDLESMRQTPKLFQQNVDLVRDYPNTPMSMANASHDDMAEHFINHVTDNLLALHDAVPEEIRNRSKLWYDGARNIVDRWSKKYNLPDHSIAAALAALSPQKDWYQNVSLAERVLDAMRGQGGNFHNGFAFNKDMENTFNGIDAFAKPKYGALLTALRGKSLADLGSLNVDDETKAAAKALWIRLHDETYNDRSHKIVTPEGNFGDVVRTIKGAPSGTGWGPLVEIGKAIRAIEAAKDPSLISSLMGEKHKVRNFYNNILAPRSPNGDVTIDTHAVAAGLWRPLSGNSLEVAHNFANYAGKGMPSAAGSALTGIQGTYPLYAEAYRRAAKERGILPREMQSITWEAVRGLFPDTFKTATNNAKIDAVWNKYRNNEISQNDARGMINEIAGGIRNPTWVVERGAGPNEAGQPSDEPGNISGIGLRGTPAEGIERGRGRKPAASVSARAKGSRAPQQIEEAATGGSVVDRALRLTSTNRPMVALAELFQRQLRGRPPS